MRSWRATLVRWVQLPMAGVERLAEAGLFSTGKHLVVWTCARAVSPSRLALAGLRRLPGRAPLVGRARLVFPLYGSRVTILGGGGVRDFVARGFLGALRILRATVVRRTAEPLAGAYGRRL